MESLPPIRASIRKGEPNAAAPPTYTDAHGPFSCGLSGPTPKTVSAEDGLNRNRLRQEAGRRVQHITCGVAERETYMDMLLHIEDRFAHTPHEELRPLVLPPQLPSIARPREPQAAKFSRGIAACHRTDRGSSAGAPLSAAAVAGVPRYTGAGGNPAAAELAAKASTEAPSASVSFTDAHGWEMPDLEDRAFFRRLMKGTQASAESSAVDSNAAAQAELSDQTASSPLDLQPTLEKKCAYLSALEAAERQRVLACERWDHQVTLEMMAVHFVTFVLKPCMDVLRKEELEQREAIAQEEDRLSFYMFNDSPLALQVQEGRRAAEARELQLERILRLTPDAPHSSAPAETPPRVTPASSEAAALASVVTGGQQKGGSDGSRPSSSCSAHTPSPAATPPRPPHGTDVPSDEARRILRNYVVRRHGASLNAVGTRALTPQDDQVRPKTTMSTYPDPGECGTVRRSSMLILPPISSAQTPRRKAVGIADYVALLDDSTKHRRKIIKAEERCRGDLHQNFYEELQVVLEWQRRRMHLERLLYWRQQREAAVQEELEALTTITPVLRLDAQALRLLAALEEEEEAVRRSIWDEECVSLAALRQAGEDARNATNSIALQKRCMDALHSEVWTAEAAARRQLLAEEEADVRHRRECFLWEHLTAMLTTGTTQLRALWHLSQDSVQYAALRVLQKAFRRSLRGRLGWHFTHQVLGREVRFSRDTRKVAAGARALQSFKDTLSAERARLCEEQAQQHLHEQHAFIAYESGGRAAVCAEQEWHHKAIARAHVQHIEVVYAPLLTACVAEENEARLELEVEEELERNELLAVNATLIDVVYRKGIIQQEERAGRKSTVCEERVSWRRLVSAELDEHEEHRIDEETREEAHARDQAAFANAAEGEIRLHHERAMAAYAASMMGAFSELLSRQAGDDPTRRAIEQAEAVAAHKLLDSMATAQCAAYASALKQRREIELIKVHQQALLIGETEDRANILHEEAAAWAADEQELLNLLSGPLHDCIVRRGAVRAISTWYIAVRNGEVGRAVSRKRLREDLARHREERQLRSGQIAQRLHMQHVRSQLDLMLEEMQREQRKAMQQLLDKVVACEEPSGREQIESLQEIVFGVLERSAEAHLAEVRHGLVNTEALIWQQEAYEREVLKKTWRRTFEQLLERRNVQLNEDRFAVSIQRAWRGHAARMRCRRDMSTRRAQVTTLEAQARVAVVLEELEEAATQLYKPYLSASYLGTHAWQSLGRACDELAVAVVESTRAYEWSERAAILWEMRYEDCDPCLCEEEARARRALEARFHKPFQLQSELKEEERLHRTMLVRERALFLLRVLAREEYQLRLSLTSVEDERRASLGAQFAATTRANVGYL
ncbi:hypothetical protein LSCM1_04322 [Leishmania martiniquensis]|uniref:Uncharacterized protein n=1 Tax=Leishmania martiniquensis TaxID=1580590 RepID=A0A836HB76_9TRYP|nr:hypothetical protein LSCM1_04322 [Leishmania martiniquensis]